MSACKKFLSYKNHRPVSPHHLLTSPPLPLTVLPSHPLPPSPSQIQPEEGRAAAARRGGGAEAAYSPLSLSAPRSGRRRGSNYSGTDAVTVAAVELATVHGSDSLLQDPMGGRGVMGVRRWRHGGGSLPE